MQIFKKKEFVWPEEEKLLHIKICGQQPGRASIVIRHIFDDDSEHAERICLSAEENIYLVAKREREFERKLVIIYPDTMQLQIFLTDICV